MAQSPSDAASGATSNREILRRMSLSGGPKRQDSLSELDPRAANPSLGLSGGIISATFCIPHSLQYKKGADWVGKPHGLLDLSLTSHRDSVHAAELLPCSILSHTFPPI